MSSASHHAFPVQARRKQPLRARLLALVVMIIALTVGLVYARQWAATAPPWTKPAPYGQDVNTWWAGHWANQASPKHILPGRLPHPRRQIMLQPGQSLQVAIDALPASGGTILVPPGTYVSDYWRIYKSNIHIVGQGPSSIIQSGTGTAGVIMGCPEAEEYSDFIRRVIIERQREMIACATTRRVQNVVLQDLTLDGANAAVIGVNIAAANGVVFENVTWQNLRNDSQPHHAAIMVHEMADNVWVRNSTFHGDRAEGTYFDGCHSCGIIGSTYTGSYLSQAMVFLSNDDLNFDYNSSGGPLEPAENRINNYLVVVDNRITRGQNTAITLEGGANTLLSGNVADEQLGRMISVGGYCDQTHDNTHTDYYHLYVHGNHAAGGAVSEFMLIDGAHKVCGPSAPIRRNSTMSIGKYTVRGNSALWLGSDGQFVREVNPQLLEGPNTVVDNRVGPRDEGGDIGAVDGGEP